MAEDKQNGSTRAAVHPQPLKAVLVVDDDKQLASALQWILVDENYLVDVAFDGEEALLKVKVHEYDAVICDLMMPRLRGDEFYIQAKELRPNLEKRFVFITGFAAESWIKDFLGTGQIRHLAKPFGIEELIGTVREVIAGKA
ncbi:MAG TPA: response regulator [Chthoniobacterales bacterium]|jgi:DNA-binding response OmpR family regulator|nr:response regulator [Chthoniobacterales bacterium]